MGLSVIEQVEWAAAAALELLAFVLAIRRRLFARQPLFGSYLTLLIADQLLMTFFYAKFGVRSHVSFYVFWALQAVLIMLRGAAVFEVFKVVLSPFSGVWKTCRGILLLVGVTLTFAAIFAASQSGPRISAIISTGGRGLELAIVGILLFGLAFSRYYNIHIETYLLWIGFAFGFYSGVQVVNNTFLHRYLLSYFPMWSRLSVFAFDISTVLWCVALWSPLPAVRATPAALGHEDYEAIAPQMTSRLRELNSRLLDIWK